MPTSSRTDPFRSSQQKEEHNRVTLTSLPSGKCDNPGLVRTVIGTDHLCATPHKFSKSPVFTLVA